MLVADLLHSCANDRVAEAAVASIGGDFFVRLHTEACGRGVSVGALAAKLVREFAQVATERDWRDLTAATRGHDVPVLAGLELILSRATAGRRGLARSGVEETVPLANAGVVATYALAG